jgi:hypothetical protein
MKEMLGPASIPFSSECNCILEKTRDNYLTDLRGQKENAYNVYISHLHKKL